MSMGDQAGARQAVSKALLINPTLTASEVVKKEIYQDREQTSHLRDLLLAAGLPQ
jgi:Tfp pilus assembly protein PilF